jgi:excisionase family DNA binding protein
MSNEVVELKIVRWVMQETTQDTQPLLVTVSQVATMLSLSRTMIYKLIDIEGLPVVRFGRSVRVSPKSLQQWLERRQSA